MENVTLSEQAQAFVDLHVLSAEIAADIVLGPEGPENLYGSLERTIFVLGYITRCREQLR